MRRVRHQHAIATGQRKIGGKGRALVAALFLYDLHQQHLTALDDVLNLVAAAQRHALAAQFVGGFVTTAFAAAALCGAFAAFGGLALILFMMGGFDQFQPIVAMMILVILEIGTQRRLFLGMLALFAQQRLAVFAGNLVIIGVNFAERQKAVAVAAIVDERRLKRGFYTGNLGEVDIAFELLVLGRFEIKLLDPVTFDDRDPGLFPVARIDQHTHCHLLFSGEGGQRHWAGLPRDSGGTNAVAPPAARVLLSSGLTGKTALLLHRQGRANRRSAPSTPHRPLSGSAWNGNHASCSVNLFVASGLKRLGARRCCRESS